MPDYVLEFDNDQQYCAAASQNECSSTYNSAPYYCTDQTNYVQTKFQDVVDAMGGAGFDWLTAGSTGCSERGMGGTLSGGEYYRLACSCSVDSGSGSVYTDGTWKIYYFDDSDCSTLFAESVGAQSGYCGGGETPTATTQSPTVTTQSPSDDENGDDGPASSVSVSLLAIFGAILAVFKSL